MKIKINLFFHYIQLPEDLPFEYLLQNAEKLYEKYPPEQIELDVQKMIIKEFVYLYIKSFHRIWKWINPFRFSCRKQQREKEAKEAAKRRLQLQRKAAARNSIVYRILPQMLWSKRSMFVTTAFSIVVGICAYYYKAHLISMTSGFSWNTANYMVFMFQRYTRGRPQINSLYHK